MGPTASRVVIQRWLLRLVARNDVSRRACLFRQRHLDVPRPRYASNLFVTLSDRALIDTDHPSSRRSWTEDQLFWYVGCANVEHPAPLLILVLVAGLIRERVWHGENGMEHVRTLTEPALPIPTFAETIQLLMKVNHRHFHHRSKDLHGRDC